MFKILFSLAFTLVTFAVGAQVKIGFNTDSVNHSALLELSNDSLAAPGQWKSFLPPRVDFTNSVFTGNNIWGIAGTPLTGAIVYNVGEIVSNGFSGRGLYCWQDNKWTLAMRY